MNGSIGADVSLVTTESMWTTLLKTYWPSGPNPHAQTSIRGAQAA